MSSLYGKVSQDPQKCSSWKARAFERRYIAS